MPLENKLSPPIINSKLPAFTGTKITVPFSLSRAVSPIDFDTVVLIIRSVQTNTDKLNGAIEDIYYQYNHVSKNYEAHFDVSATEFKPVIGQYYKVQIALRSAGSGIIGYYSTVGILKCTAEPRVTIKELLDGSRQHVYEYTGVYSHKEDISEKVYSYCFNLYNESNELVATSGELIHDNSKDTDSYESTDVWSVRKNLDANVNYEIEYNVTTVNGLKKTSGRYPIIESETKAPNVHADLVIENVFEDGYMLIKLVGDNSGALVTGRFILMRSSSEDNFETWYELARFDLSKWDSNTTKVLCKDYIVKQGIEYVYAIRAYNSLGLFSDRLKNKGGAVKCDFEDAFLYDGERQLKIRFNPKMTSFKSTILESKTDTIGGKFPFIFRNGNVTYKEFPISGLIALHGDENNEFLSNLFDTSEVLQDFKHELTTDNIRREREFKLMVLSWLTNGKPKLFRSPTEGNYIIRLMNTSLTPNDTLGRMLHTFSSTAYEIAEYNFENLKSLGFAMADYIETRTLRMNQIDLNNPPKEMIKNGVIVLPSAVYVSISATPYTQFEYTLEDSTTNPETIVSTGNFIFPQSILATNPMIAVKLISDSWGKKATLTYGYHDIAADTFSIVHNITISDEILQLVGEGFEEENNLVDELEDIRLKVGAFHYIRVQPRDTMKIYKQGDSYYFNNTGNKVTSLNPSIIYHVYNGVDAGATQSGMYLDGKDGIDGQLKSLDELNYNFHISGMQKGEYVDFNGNNVTTGRYDALTGFSNIDELYAGNGLLLDIVYQRKEILYVVEVVGGEYYDYKTGQAKIAWQEDLKYYHNLISENASSTLVNAWKDKVDNSYGIYLYWLEEAIKSIEEEYGVEYAL